MAGNGEELGHETKDMRNPPCLAVQGRSIAALGSMPASREKEGCLALPKQKNRLEGKTVEQIEDQTWKNAWVQETHACLYALH